MPYRGRPNEPAYVAVVGEFVAALRGVEASRPGRDATSANTARLFGLAGTRNTPVTRKYVGLPAPTGLPPEPPPA